MPTVCSGIGWLICTFSPLGSLTMRKASSSPIFSAPPCAMTVFLSMSKSLYLMDDDPQLRTKIFMIFEF